MMKQFFAERRPHNGLTFDQYLEEFRQFAAEHTRTGSGAPGGIQTDHLVLNLHRTERILRSYEPQEATTRAVCRIAAPQLWMILTEYSCGDSAQVIPVIARIAAFNPAIDLRILFRDANMDIMDLYLTNGTRGIPKLVAFAADGRELFQWGPRTEDARRIFQEGIAAGTPKNEVVERVHLFYGRDRGKSVERELFEILSRD